MSLTGDEHECLRVLHDAIAETIRRAQKVPASIDRHCMALVVTKLEEAEHWALQARRIAADRQVAKNSKGRGEAAGTDTRESYIPPSGDGGGVSAPVVSIVPPEACG